MVNWRLPRVVRFRPSLRVRIGLLLAALAATSMAAAALPLLMASGRLSLPTPFGTWTADPATDALGLMLVVLFLAGLLAVVVFRQVLGPIRRLALEGLEDADAYGNEVEVLDRRLRHLLDTMRRTQVQLEESHETLRQTEKLALVGKLAAGVAHSIRNPLTSVKLRLFALERSLKLGPDQKEQQEDFEVIAAEIRHLDAIVTNFLEFSRRPRLRMQPVSPSDVVDMTLQLLKHRLESFNVAVSVHRTERLPLVDGDAEQLKEALVNLILNACEAMGYNGALDITEEKGIINPLGRAVVIRIADSGPGVPQHIRDEVFQPFFSTKEEGTGLGLPIARRIFEEHGGWLHLHSAHGKGATFVIVLPARKDDSWLRS